jgi:hypothetical protein
LDRPKFYSGQIWRSYDVNNIGRNAMKADCRLAEAMLGSTDSVASGLAATAQSVPNMTINIGPGQLLQLSEIDATVMGSIDADTNIILQQGVVETVETVSFNISGLTGTQQKWGLVQGQFRQVDEVPVDDPDDGIIPFFDSTNPLVPLEGPDGLGGILATLRRGAVAVEVIYGTAAAAGTAVPPTPTTGWVPLYLVLISNNQLAVSNGDIQVAGPQAYAGYQHAPFLAGLTQQHHLGIAGHAPQIDLGLEVTGELGFANLPGSNQTPDLADSIKADVGPFLSVCYQGAVNPNGNWPGEVGDEYLQLAGQNLLFKCTSAGPASGLGQAEWTQVGFAGGIVDVTSWVTAYSPTPGNNVYLLHTTSVPNPIVNLLTTVAMLATRCSFKNIGNVPATIQPASGQNIEGYAIDAPYTLQPGDQLALAPSGGTNYIIGG